jgi:hypothetical protein
MRSYGSNITVDGENKFETLVLDLLAQISRRSTGVLILNEIARNSGRKVKIVSSAHHDKAYLDDSKNPAVARDARIAYPPLPVSGGSIALPGDQALLHRLVLALHRIRGGFERVPMRGGFDYRDEFYAILITNMYASEDRRPLRCDLYANGGTEEFCSENSAGIEELSQEGPGLGLRLFMGLSRVSAPFNPIRQHIKEKAAGFGYTPEAWARDQIRSPMPQYPSREPRP